MKYFELNAALYETGEIVKDEKGKEWKFVFPEGAKELTKAEFDTAMTSRTGKKNPKK